ncbi:hypothetical protein [Fusobacterium sp. PH5-44]|uniref:hypothetical protein n=1 Tax=unclassified Fusobacterium TaxID=2648384 RepID=UPI003D1DE97C
MKKFLALCTFISFFSVSCPNNKMHDTVKTLIKQGYAKETKTKIVVNTEAVLKSCLYDSKLDLETAKAKASALLDYCVSYGQNHNLIYEDELRIGQFINGKYIIDYKK